MADLNSIYNGVTEYFDPKADSGIPNYNGNIFNPRGTNKWLEEMDFWPQLDAINKASVSTIQAVKVPYTGSTTAERTQWLIDRINAINNRVSFIKGRVNQLLNNLQALGDATYDGLLKSFSLAVSAFPVVGTVVNYFVGQQTTAQAVQQLQVQQLIKDYTADLGQLATIRTELTKELVSLGGSTDPTSNAPSVPTWYWFVGAGLLLLLLVWYRKRKKRRKR